MASCERCWSRSDGAEDYSRVMREAERDELECTKNTVEGARLRAGQWWDEATQRDTRTTRVTRAGG